MDSAGNIFVADTANNSIRRIGTDGSVSTFAGSTVRQVGSTDGVGIVARFFHPRGLCFDPSGNLYVSDTVNFLIRKISPGAAVITVAGAVNTPGFVDGPGAAARFNETARGLVADASGNIYIADTDNHAIRQLSPSGSVTTVAGANGLTGYGDGVGAAARFRFPQGVAIDPSGNLIVLDTANNLIRGISPQAGKSRRWPGRPGSQGFGDGAGTAVRFSISDRSRC